MTYNVRSPESFRTQPDGPEQGLCLQYSPISWGWGWITGFRVSPAWRYGDPLILNGQYFDGLVPVTKKGELHEIQM